MAERLLDAMAGAAARQYGGEPVSELAHSLQCAELAQAAGADEEVVLACLLHDAGRFAVDQSLIFDSKESGSARADARGHHELGAQLIAPFVPERVAWLVGMHAEAKRYLCATEPAYFTSLTPASRHTLGLQGGPLTPAQVAALAGHPWLADALRLRRWDDQAKVPGKVTRPLAAWEPVLRAHFTTARHRR